MTTWKATERRVARDLGGQRVGQGGLNDVRSGRFSVEVKHRKRLPQWLKKAMSQAERNCAPGRLPIVVLHELHAWGEKDLVCLRLKTLQTLMAPAFMSKQTDRIFERKRISSIARLVCMRCGEPATEFNDALSAQKYNISGICQTCQDNFF